MFNWVFPQIFHVPKRMVFPNWVIFIVWFHCLKSQSIFDMNYIQDAFHQYFLQNLPLQPFQLLPSNTGIQQYWAFGFLRLQTFHWLLNTIHKPIVWHCSAQNTWWLVILSSKVPNGLQAMVQVHNIMASNFSLLICCLRHQQTSPAPATSSSKLTLKPLSTMSYNYWTASCMN